MFSAVISHINPDPNSSQSQYINVSFFVNLPATKADYVWCLILRMWYFMGSRVKTALENTSMRPEPFNTYSAVLIQLRLKVAAHANMSYMSVWCSWLPADRVQRQCLSWCLYQWPVVIWELQQGVRRGLATKARWNMHWPEIELTDLARLCVLSVLGFDKNKSLIALGLRGCDCSICSAPFLVVTA